MTTNKKYSYDYPRPGVCADCIVYWTCPDTCKIYILLIKRKNQPYQNFWALAGGFVNEGETLKLAARRELEEETGIRADDLDFWQIADKVDRDPRGWTLAAIFVYHLFGDKPEAQAADDAVELQWFSIDNLPELAFDHKDILDYYFQDKGYYATDE